MSTDKQIEKITNDLIYFGLNSFPKISEAMFHLAQRTPEPSAQWDNFKEMVARHIKQAYVAGEVNAVNALQSQSPLKCWECSGDDLIFDSNCQWDNRRMQWVITWRQTEEAYCRACDQQVQVALKLYGDHENFTMRLV